MNSMGAFSTNGSELSVWIPEGSQISVDYIEQVKAEEKAILETKLPLAQKEFEEVCQVWSVGDHPYDTTLRKVERLESRLELLQEVVQNSVYVESVGVYVYKKANI
jgi:hypothetical protein